MNATLTPLLLTGPGTDGRPVPRRVDCNVPPCQQTGCMNRGAKQDATSASLHQIPLTVITAVLRCSELKSWLHEQLRKAK